MENTVGYIFPIPSQLIGRLTDGSKNVIVKYVRGTMKYLDRKDKVLFYASRGEQMIVGEGEIDKIEFLTPLEALARYGSKIILNKDELLEYTLSQKNRSSKKEMLVIVLSKIRKYQKPVKPIHKITMTGQYINNEDYAAIISLSNL
jgi:hypothetical protein